MRIARTLPPAAASHTLGDVATALARCVTGNSGSSDLSSSLQTYFGSRHQFLLSSGKAALTTILRSLADLSPGRTDVLIPAYTCYSVPSAIVRAGLRVRLADIDNRTLDFDFTHLKSAIFCNNPHDGNGPPAHQRLLAVISTHLFGLPADTEGLRRMTNNSGAFIVEDAAQVMGAAWQGHRLGTKGDCGFFSLGRGKALSAAEGGIVITHNERIAAKIQARMDRLKPYGGIEKLALVMTAAAVPILQRPSFFWLPKTMPFLHLGETIYDPDFKMRTMSSLQTALMQGWEERSARLRRFRRQLATHYRDALAALGIEHFTALAGKLPDLVRFPVLLSDVNQRNAVLRESDRQGLGVMPGYPDSIDAIPQLRGASSPKPFPNAKRIASLLVTLPLHPWVTPKDRDRIVALFDPRESTAPPGTRTP